MTLPRRILNALLVTVLALGLLACALHVVHSEEATIAPPPDGSLRLATLNVHYILLNEAEGAWSVGDWDARKEAMDAAFKTIGADLFAFQEMESFAGGNSDDVNLARRFLLERNPGYAAAATGPWRDFASTQPVFYRTARLRVLDQGWFFFSDTPDVIYSRTFNGSYPAFASWVLFRDADGRRLRVINVHFEYSSRTNRLKSARLVAQRAAPWIAAGEAVVLAGDLNARAGAETLEILEAVGFAFLPVPGATYHLNRGVNLFGAIDHIALAGPLRAATPPVVVQRRFDGVFPSDHYPVFADIRPDTP